MLGEIDLATRILRKTVEKVDEVYGEGVEVREGRLVIKVLVEKLSH